MTTSKERVLIAISKKKPLELSLRKHYQHFDSDESTDYVERFISDVKRYLSALEEGRLIASHIVTNNGMTHHIKIMDCVYSDNINKHCYMNFNALFSALNIPRSKREGYFRVSGGNINALFHLNMQICTRLGVFGAITENRCLHFEQIIIQTI